MKKQHSLTKQILAAFAAAAALLSAGPAQADTSWVRGGMWASAGGEPYNIVYPDGITSSTTPTQAAAVADSVADDYYKIGINFVRIDVDPATISGNWSVVQAYVNELVADGLYVDICCSYVTTNSVIPDMSTWESCWQTIDGVYKNNNRVYYEPINEPYGYNLSGLESVYTAFLNSYGIAKGHSFIILDAGGSGAGVPALGAVYTDCSLTFHDYYNASLGYTTESQWETQVQNAAGACANRTIVTEFGAPTTTGLDYQVSSSDNYVTFLRGVCTEFRALPMGSVWFPAHQNTANNKRMFTGIGGSIFDRSALNEVQYGWNFFTPVEAPGCDFNNIGMTDRSLFRPSSQDWEIQSGGGGQYGANTDIAVPADYNGTGKAQMAVWRPSQGDWYVYPSLNATHWGTNGDIPVPGDYLGAGSAQFAVWRPSNGTWYIKGGSTLQWGTSGDIPVPGYYNGDGHVDCAVYRPSNNTWYVYGQTAVQFGQAGDIPVPGDYSGSGTTQIAVFRPSNGTWYINGVGYTQFGQTGDVPVPGDYTGSGFTQMATWTTNFVWNVYGGGGGITWGTTDDVPLPLPYAIRHGSLGYNN